MKDWYTAKALGLATNPQMLELLVRARLVIKQAMWCDRQRRYNHFYRVRGYNSKPTRTQMASLCAKAQAVLRLRNTQGEESRTWRDETGELWYIADMPNDHLLSTIYFLQRRGRKETTQYGWLLEEAEWRQLLLKCS